MIANKHAYFAVPAGDKPPSPMIIVSRLGGAPQVGEAPLDNGRIEFAVWADTKHASSQVELALCAALFDMATEQLDAGVVGHGAQIESRVWLPDPGSTLGRYLVTAMVIAVAGQLGPA